MIEYFPTNYVWNLSVNIALATGANHGEVDEVCRQLVEASQRTETTADRRRFSGHGAIWATAWSRWQSRIWPSAAR